MASGWREVLEQLDITASSAAGPAGSEGDWFQLVAAFGAKAFLRALTDGEDLAVECAPPGDVKAARGALEAAGWQLEGDAVPFVARRDFPDDADALRPHWVCLAKLADATREEDADAFQAALHVDEEAPDESGDAEEQEDDDQNEESEADERSEPSDAKTTGSAFEPIGEEEPRPPMQAQFAFALARDGDTVEVTLGLADTLERRVYEKLEGRLIGNLRGKYDVDVEIAGAHEVVPQLDVEPKTRIALRVRPAIGARKFTVRDAENAVAGYFENLLELASAGIDPLVFLGVRASKRNTGAFEAIGSETSARAPADDRSEHSAARGDSDVEDDEEQVLLVDDDEPEDDPPRDDVEEVVFTDGAPLDEDAPLEPGRFDDARLKRADATTSLVDVVLRHPGYSDRSIGQVMSILLSLDYSACLEIAERAPTVVAWGVSRDRALTMKTVIEGAGGKVVLVEPGTFGED